MNIKETFSLKVERHDEISRADIQGVVPKEKIQEARSAVLEHLQKEKKIDGFRDGTAPLDVVERTVGALEVWRQSAHEVIMRNFPEILAAEKLVPLGSPSLSFVSIPNGGDVEFHVSFFTMPKVTLPDYVAIVRQMEGPKEAETATEEDVQQVVNDVRRSLYKKAHPEKDFPTDDKELPELTDAYVQEISHQYKDLDGFLKGVRESITREKKMQEQGKFRQKILDAVLEKTPVTIPENIIEEDSKNAYADFEKRVERFNMTVESYLKEQDMTEKELREEIKDESRKRAHTQLVMNSIAVKENINADSKEVEKEVERFKQRKSDMNDDQIRTYIETLLVNEMVMRFLEEQVISFKRQDDAAGEK